MILVHFKAQTVNFLCFKRAPKLL